MLLTKKHLNSYLEGHFITIPKCLEEKLLAILGSPIVVYSHVYEFTEPGYCGTNSQGIVSYFYDNPKSSF